MTSRHPGSGVLLLVVSPRRPYKDGFHKSLCAQPSVSHPAFSHKHTPPASGSAAAEVALLFTHGRVSGHGVVLPPDSSLCCSTGQVMGACGLHQPRLPLSVTQAVPVARRHNSVSCFILSRPMLDLCSDMMGAADTTDEPGRRSLPTLLARAICTLSGHLTV